MVAALSDINGWYASETALGLNSTQEKIIADVNKDGVVNNADLQMLINILLAGGGSLLSPTSTAGMHQKPALGLNSTQEKIIADVNKDGVVNNADLQMLINILLAGGGSGTAVPEPHDVRPFRLCRLLHNGCGSRS